MTRNEKIAEKMGWVGNYWGSLLERRTPDNDIVLAKILQQRMVDDGWIVVISDSGIAINPDVKVRCSAIASSVCHHDTYSATEPAAIFELFCRVYGIPASE